MTRFLALIILCLTFVQTANASETNIEWGEIEAFNFYTGVHFFDSGKDAKAFPHLVSAVEEGVTFAIRYVEILEEKMGSDPKIGRNLTEEQKVFLKDDFPQYKENRPLQWGLDKYAESSLLYRKLKENPTKNNWVKLLKFANENNPSPHACLLVGRIYKDGLHKRSRNGWIVKKNLMDALDMEIRSRRLDLMLLCERYNNHQARSYLGRDKEYISRNMCLAFNFHSKQTSKTQILRNQLMRMDEEKFKRNTEISTLLTAEAAFLGHSQAQIDLLGTLNDPEDKKKLLFLASRGDHPDAFFLYASRLPPKTHNTEKRALYLKTIRHPKATDVAKGRAYFGLGVSFKETQNFNEAFEAMEEAVKFDFEDRGSAHHLLAQWRQQGKGVEEDYEASIPDVLKAADAGFRDMQWHAALYYLEVKGDLKQGTSYLEMAAKQNHPASKILLCAEDNLERLHQSGRGSVDLLVDSLFLGFHPMSYKVQDLFTPQKYVKMSELLFNGYEEKAKSGNAYACLTMATILDDSPELNLQRPTEISQATKEKENMTEQDILKGIKTLLSQEMIAPQTPSGRPYTPWNSRESLKYYDQFLTMNPKAARILNHVGLIHMRKGSLKKALKYFSDAHTLQPENLHFLTHLGLCEQKASWRAVLEGRKDTKRHGSKAYKHLYEGHKKKNTDATEILSVLLVSGGGGVKIDFPRAYRYTNRCLEKNSSRCLYINRAFLELHVFKGHEKVNNLKSFQYLYLAAKEYHSPVAWFIIGLDLQGKSELSNACMERAKTLGSRAAKMFLREKRINRELTPEQLMEILKQEGKSIKILTNTEKESSPKTMKPPPKDRAEKDYDKFMDTLKIKYLKRFLARAGSEIGPSGKATGMRMTRLAGEGENQTTETHKSSFHFKHGGGKPVKKLRGNRIKGGKDLAKGFREFQLYLDQ